MPDIGMVIRQFAGLIGNRLRDFLAAIAHIDAIESGKCIQHAIAVPILDEHARCCPDHPVRAFAARVLGEVCRGMKEVVPIPLIELIIP